MEPSKPFPIYQLMDAFEAFSNGEADVKPQHRSLYYFLVGYARKRGNVPRYNMPYENGMHGSGIGSWATYDAALKALEKWGFLVYTPGANRFKVPVIELTFRNPTGDVLLTYWQSYCISTSNPTANSTDDINRVLEKERKRVEEAERLRDSKAQELAAAHAAAALAEKKIGALEKENHALKAELLELTTQRPASHTGGPSDVPTRKAERFAAPTVEMVLGYFLAQRPNNPLAALEQLADKWHGHYSANGWKVGRNPMRDWQAACRTWLADVPKMTPGSFALAQPLPSQPYRTQPPISQVGKRQELSAALHAKYANLKAQRDGQ